MNRTTIIVAVGLALAAALPATPASALNARTFVSGHGNDANPCNFSGPCRTFAAAYAKTAPSGEITVLDPAGYGPLTITTALSIVNDGVGEAGVILIAAGNAITINAGASDAISLRGLSLDGGGTASTIGIRFNSGKSLTVQNCVIRHFSSDGIGFFPNATSSLLVSNTVASDNGSFGISVWPTGSGPVTAVFNRVETNNNFNGILVYGSDATGIIKATVVDSVAASNSGKGFFASSLAGHAGITLSLLRSVAADNQVGLLANSTTIRFAQSMITGNSDSGWLIAGSGVIASYQDNYIDGNGPNFGSLTSIGKQ